ncbi:Transmembrane protein [Cupriavidus necator]
MFNFGMHMAMYESVGAIDFLGTALGVVALSGTITDVSVETSYRTRATRNLNQQLRDVQIDTYHTYSVWLRLRDGKSAVLRLVNPGFPIRVGNMVTAYYAGQNGQNLASLQLVGFEDRTMGKVFDMAGRARLPQPPGSYMLRFAVVSAFGAIALHWLAVHVLVLVLSAPLALYLMNGWVDWWVCAIPAGIWYMGKTVFRDKRLAKCRRDLFRLIRGHRISLAAPEL